MTSLNGFPPETLGTGKPDSREPPMIEAQGLSKEYGRPEARVQALKNVDFRLEPGEFAAIMGPSGSGKSTLLSLLGALSAPSAGRVLIDGVDVYGLGSDTRADFRLGRLGFVFQQFHLAPYLNLLENVMLPLAVRKMESKEKRARALDALARVGVDHLANRLPDEVSGGEQERAAMARALVNRPTVLLADEPTGNLDQANGEKVMNLLAELAAGGMTVVMVTHSASSARFAGRILHLADGRLVADEKTAVQPEKEQGGCQAA
jgi:putative ABC transport system ATP-binding protein